MPKIDREDIQYQLQYIPVSLIDYNDNNMRFEEDINADSELAKSIHESGIIQPLVVRLLENGRFKLLCGSRRYKAALKNKIKEIPVIIINSGNDKVLTLVENLHRKELTTFEKAVAIKMLVEESNDTLKEIAHKTGTNKSYISKMNALAGHCLGDYKSVSYTQLAESTYLELVNYPDLLKKAEDENWNQLKAREEANKLKNAQNEKSEFIHLGKIKNTPVKNIDALLPAHFKQSQLVAYKPIEFKDNGFTINAFYFDKNQAFDVEAIVEKLQELQNNLDFAIRIIRKDELSSDDEFEEMYNVIQ